MNSRAKACDISPKVKEVVYDRDEGQCILCGNPGIPNAHFIPRSAGGLGVEQNVVTLCPQCHMDYDQSPLRKEYAEKIRKYLDSVYADWDEEALYYHNPMRMRLA